MVAHKKNGRTEAAEKSSKTRQLATRIVAFHDRLTLALCRFLPRFSWALSADSVLALLVAALACLAWWRTA